MRFFHLSDLHFGKFVHSVPMVDQDQPYWVDRFLEKVDEYHPDAVLIAGDVYDKRIPSPEAVNLLSYMITQLSKKNIPTIMIAGNHDSGERLSFAKELLKEQQFYIAGTVTKELECITLSDEYGDVNIYLMPYLYPRIVADESVLGNLEITSYDQAVRELIAVQNIDPAKRNVILVHQNVLAGGEKPEHSESETFIGGLGEIDYTAFDPFDYVAMGHIHNAQHMGRDTVRYAGCPLYYDFSEEGRSKYLTMIDMKEKGNIQITKIDMPLLHKMIRLSGTVDEIISQKKELSDISSYYIQAIITERHVPANALERLRGNFGDQLISVIRNYQNTEATSIATTTATQRKQMSMEELFSEFYQQKNGGDLLTAAQEDFLEKLIEHQSHQDIAVVTKARKTPEVDVDELVSYLLKTE